MSDPVSFPTMDESDISAGDAVFLYQYIMRLADESRLNDVLNECLSKMMTLGQQLKMNPKVAETTLLSLLHVFKQLLALVSQPRASFARRAIPLQQSAAVLCRACACCVRIACSAR